MHIYKSPCLNCDKFREGIACQNFDKCKTIHKYQIELITTANNTNPNVDSISTAHSILM